MFYKITNQNVINYKRQVELEINELIGNIEKHQSIDTYAKKLSVQGNTPKLYMLKKILATFFIYEQYTNPTDIRYDSFIASLISVENKDFPKNVNVLTWNYDCQFELSLCNFLGLERIEKSQERFNIIPHVEQRHNQFGIFKLNGSANFINKNDITINSFNGELPDRIPRDYLVEELMIFYLSPEVETKTAINYSWENNINPNNGESTWYKAKVAATNSEVLVVVGYSFPFFNRTIDQKIIQSIAPRKVYIQAPKENVNNVIQSFKSIGLSNDVIVEPITETDQFFLPPELAL